MRDRPLSNSTACQTLNGPDANHSGACSRLNPSISSDDHLQWVGHSLDVTVSLLWIITPVIATASVAVVLVAMTTNQWLITQENMANPNYNGSGGAEFLPKSTVSGLWQLCHSNPGENVMVCTNIDYFPIDDYIPDPNDSTMAIPYTVSKSAGFFIIATLVLLTGELCCLCGHVSRQRRLLTFISGLSFIVSGLFMLIGLVMYISVLKAEIGGKLRPRSLLQPPMFTFRYGFSFVLYVTGFIITEIAGTCAVFLYIYWHQREWMHKRLLMSHEQLSIRIGATCSLYVETGLVPLCRRHPQLYISNTNMRLTPPLPARYSPIIHRRLYLDKATGNASDCEPSSKCIHHGKILTHVPLPSEAYYHGNGFPRDATTNTMSTAADDDDEYSPSVNHDHEFVPFDLDSVPQCPLRRTTPV